MYENTAILLEKIIKILSDYTVAVLCGVCPWIDIQVVKLSIIYMFGSVSNHEIKQIRCQ